MRTRQEIKAQAREQLGNSIFSDKWLLMILALIIESILISVSSWIAILTAGPLAFGFCRIMVSVRKGEDEKADCGKIFTGFTEAFGGSVILALVEDIFLFFWSCLLFIPGIIKSYSYSLSMFLLQENPNASFSEVHGKSKKLMKGHKWDLFVLDLSFIGWYLLGMLCLGIGVIFVAPYHEMARMNFCMDVIEEEYAKVEVVPEIDVK